MIYCEVNRITGKISEESVEKWAKAVFKNLKIKNAAISVAIVGNKDIKKLNKKYRGKNKPTDVLSFREKESVGFPRKIEKNYLGEIIISYQEVGREAREDGESGRETFKKLLTHGILHLLGYDHEKNKKDAVKMLKLQEDILKKMKKK